MNLSSPINPHLSLLTVMPASSETSKQVEEEKTRAPNQPKTQIPDEIEDEEDEDNDIELEEDQINPNPSQSNRAAAAVVAPEVVLDGGIRLSEFPPAFRWAANRPHSSVVAILAVERASLCGSSRQDAVVLENISYGQLQALSAVPPDSLVEQDRSDGSYMITPPMLMEGRSVVKRFGSSLVHVVPMHAGELDRWCNHGHIGALDNIPAVETRNRSKSNNLEVDSVTKLTYP